METHTRRLDSLNGSVTGVKLRENTVVQYRGIPYAEINERFDLPAAVHNLNGTTFDGTKHGPICPQQDFDSERMWFNIPDDQDIYHKSQCVQDEFKCLNLIVTTPAGADTAGPYPVLLYIHGGSFAFGSAVRKVEDLAGIVAESQLIGKPIVAVSINYRVNLLGFSYLHGRGNHGLYDQRCAMEWVRDHIRDFSGDPSRVTLAGDSSGGASVHAHLVTAPPGLFSRAIMFSGTLGTTPAHTVHEQEFHMKKVCQQLGIEWGENGWEEAYRRVPLKKLKGVFHKANYPTLDSFFGPMSEEAKVDLFEGVSGAKNEIEIPSGCDAVLLGDNAEESQVFALEILRQDQEALEACIRGSLPNNEKGHRILLAYPDSCTEDRDIYKIAFEMLTDMLFAQPITSLSAALEASKMKVFRYTFDQSSPFQPDIGPIHDAQLLFSWNAYDISMDEEATRVRRKFQKRLLRFIHQEDPWRSGAAYGFGPDGFAGELSAQEYSLRRRVDKMDVFRDLSQDNVQNLARAMLTGRVQPATKAKF